MSNSKQSPPNTIDDVSPQNTTTMIRQFESNDVSYEVTATTFKKTSRLPFSDPYPDGTPLTWFRSLNHERITNEAKALQLVADKTTIPVPRVLEHGELSDGRRYLVTEFIEGLTLKETDSQSCVRPAGQQHTEDTPCKMCSEQAHSNALDFITNIVMPQLAELKSRERGIDGFVMPPSWLSPDAQPPWKGKTSWKTIPVENPDYVFQHGDIAPQSILMDQQTLQVKALVGWEPAGYFPPGMERWSGTLNMSDYYKRATTGLPEAIAEFLAQEYLECLKEWSDEDEIYILVGTGELPDPVLVVFAWAKQNNREDALKVDYFPS